VKAIYQVHSYGFVEQLISGMYRIRGYIWIATHKGLNRLMENIQSISKAHRIHRYQNNLLVSMHQQTSQ